MNKLLSRMVCLLMAGTMLITVTGCSNEPDNTENSGASTATSKITESTEDSSIDANSSDIESSEGEVLKPNVSTQTSAPHKNTNTSSTATIKESPAEDYVIDTPQEKKFASLKGTTIRVAALKEEIKEGSSGKAFFDYCAKKYNVKFDFIDMSWKETISKLGNMVAAGNPPDSVFLTENEFLQWTYSNVLQPMSPYIVQDPEWNDLSLSYFKTNNKLYAIPTSTPDASLMVYLVYFNKTLFKEQNVKTPYDHYKAGTWTWEELLKTAERMTLYRSDGKTVKTNGLSCWNPNVWVLANGGTGMKETQPGIFESTYTDAADMRGLNFVYQLSQIPTIDIDPYSGFANRSLAMHVERPGNAVGQFDYYNTMDDEIGMAPLPAAADGKYYAPVACYGMGVPRKAANPLGGAMIAYERFRNEQRLAKKPVGDDLKIRRQKISDEHLAILQDYMSKAIPKKSFIEGLSGWQDDTNYGRQFWSKISVDKMTPSAAVASMESVLKAAIKRTTGN